MRFEGTVDKDGKLWLVEIPALDALTQGRTRQEALAMAKQDAATQIAHCPWGQYLTNTLVR